MSRCAIYCIAWYCLLAGSSVLLAADDPARPVDYEWVKITTNAAFAPRDGAGASPAATGRRER